MTVKAGRPVDDSTKRGPKIEIDATTLTGSDGSSWPVDQEVEDQCVQHGQCGVADRAAMLARLVGATVEVARGARGARPPSSASAGSGRSAARWRGHRRCNENFTPAAVVARAPMLPVAFLGLLPSPSGSLRRPSSLALCALRASRELNAEAQLATAAATIAHAMMRIYNFPLRQPPRRRASARTTQQSRAVRISSSAHSRPTRDRLPLANGRRSSRIFADDRTAGTRLVIASSRRSAGRSRLPVTSRKRRAGSRHLIG